MHFDDGVDTTKTASAVSTSPTDSPPSPAEPTGDERRYARKAVLASAVGYGLDGFDLLVLAFALSGIITSFSLTETQAGSLATITLFGAVLGGFIFGSLADRYGRVRVLTWSVVLFAVFTGLAALSTGFWDLAFYRFIAGVGIGGEFGIGMTLAAEAVRAKYRARATSWVGIGFQFGVLAAAFASAPIISLWGWRGLFVVGILPAVIAVFIRKHTEESPKFLAAKSREAESGTVPTRESFRLLVADARTIRISFAMVILTSVQNFGYFGIMIWLPSYLSQRFDMSLTNSAVWTAVTVTGMMLGIVAFGQLADRIGRRPAFWTFQIGAAASVLLYSLIDAPFLLLPGGFIMGIFANGMLGGYGALMAELYPTKARATAQNVLFNIGRGVGGLGPIAIAVVAGQQGFPFAIGMLSTIYVLAFFTMFLVPERKGSELK